MIPTFIHIHLDETSFIAECHHDSGDDWAVIDIKAKGEYRGTVKLYVSSEHALALTEALQKCSPK